MTDVFFFLISKCAAFFSEAKTCPTVTEYMACGESARERGGKRRSTSQRGGKERGGADGGAAQRAVGSILLVVANVKEIKFAHRHAKKKKLSSEAIKTSKNTPAIVLATNDRKI
jgi:hypothetical protein